MNIDIQEHIPSEFPSNSRVWVYQSSRILSLGEIAALEEKKEAFLLDWHTHGKKNSAYINLFFGQFLVIMADETEHKVSGCSVDASVRFVKELEKLFNISMLDRFSLAFIVKDKVQVLPMSQLEYAIDNQFVTMDTLYFNNLVSTKEELLHSWILPVKKTWLAKRYAF